MPKPKGLSEKQRRFVEAYMGEAAGNSTEAARLAGYKGNDNTLASVGVENLRKPAIAAAVDKRVSADPLIASRIDRQQFWTRVMRGLEGGEMKDRLRASELLGKTQADFIDRSVVEAKVDATATIIRYPINGREGASD